MRLRHATTSWSLLASAGAALALVAASAFLGGAGAGAAPAALGDASAGGAVTVQSGSTATAVYSATETVDAPPPSTFPGAGGAGDGWAVALSSTQVFNVVHHKPYLEIDCHEQSDASTCSGYPKEITEQVDGQTVPFGVSGQPGMWLDQATGDLYVFATSESSSDTTQSASGGVVCIDTTSSSSDPFCGFTVLGNSPLVPYPNGPLPDISAISDPVLLGTNWYAFNYFFGAAATGSEDEMYCFSTTSLAACPDQPYPVDHGGGTVISNNGIGYDPTNPLGQNGCDSDLCPVPSPVIAAAGGDVFVPYTTSTSNGLACFDAAKGGGCSGSWPVTLAEAYSGESGGEFALLDKSGTVLGICLPWSGDPCYDLNGAPATDPAGLTSVIGQTLQWDGPAVQLGPRVYLPDGFSNQVLCFDFSTDASCTNFPVAMQNLGELYTVNRDPLRPTCLWVNADNGQQLQDLDAYTGAGCEQNPLRVLASAVIVPQAACAPVSWNSLTVLTPQRSAYTSGTVMFDDGDGNALPGLPTEDLDSNGSVDLSGLAIPDTDGLPEFLLSLTNPPPDLTSVVVQLTWTADYSATCLQPGTTAAPAALTLDKTVADATPGVGTRDTFTLTAHNAGPSETGNVVVSDDLPDGLGYDSSNPSAGSVSVSGQDITWSIPDLAAPGGATLAIVVTVVGTAPVSNTATFTQTVPGADGATTGTSDTVTVTPQYAHVTLSKTAATLRPNVGAEDTFTLAADDAGPDAAGRVVVTDDLASGLAYDSSTASAGTVKVSGQDVTWTIPDLGLPGGSSAGATLHIVVTVDTPAAASNVASFTQATPESDGATVGQSGTVTLTPLTTSLTLTKTVSDAQPLSGADDSYTIHLVDDGPDAAAGVVVTDVMPAGVTVLSTSQSTGTVTGTGPSSAATLTWAVGTLAAGDSATLKIDVAVSATSGSVVNEAQLTSTTYDTNANRQSATATFTVTQVVPPTHTGEPWSGPLYWLLIALLGALGLLALGRGRRARVSR